MPQYTLRDFCDGELFRNNQLFREDPSALQIQLYYDELELCNPLGSKAKKHKLGMDLVKGVVHTVIFLSHRPFILYFGKSRSHTSLFLEEYSST